MPFLGSLESTPTFHHKLSSASEEAFRVARGHIELQAIACHFAGQTKWGIWWLEFGVGWNTGNKPVRDQVRIFIFVFLGFFVVSLFPGLIACLTV